MEKGKKENGNGNGGEGTADAKAENTIEVEVEVEASPPQSSQTFDTLVFSGGHCQTVAFVGCLRWLEECRAREAVRTAAGSSAGAILALMTVMGVTCDEMEQWADRILSSRIHQLDVEAVFELFENLGLDSGQRLEAYIRDVLWSHTGFREATFAQLHQHAACEGRRLVVCASDVAAGMPEYFSVDTSPDVSVVSAIRASMCIPILFTPVLLGDKMYLDGGMFQNLPTGFLADGNGGGQGEGETCRPRHFVASNVLALNIPWELPTRLPTDLITYVDYVTASLLFRTNACMQPCLPTDVKLTTLEIKIPPCDDAGFCASEFEFKIDAPAL
ncbi:MAG: patatin-like phospholipase family protein, partial [Halobacteriaceae archaeon]